jgi:predicted RNA-binding Zn-ribbon protein involved in translation (DUF1610 family)
MFDNLFMKIKIDINYFSRQSGQKKWSHKNTEEWGKLELFCPHCGEQNVWHETGPGDDSVGEQYMCAACGSSFYLAGGVRERSRDDEQNKQRFSVLSNAASEGRSE